MKLCTTLPHGPPTLRPFPDADASISCNGNAVWLTTTTTPMSCTANIRTFEYIYWSTGVRCGADMSL